MRFIPIQQENEVIFAPSFSKCFSLVLLLVYRCWSHPGSYLGEVGIVTNTGTTIRIQPGDAATGFASVQLNDTTLQVGERVPLAFRRDAQGHVRGMRSSYSISYDSTHEISIITPRYSIILFNSDMFVNPR